MKKRNILLTIILSIFVLALASCKTGRVKAEVYKDSEKYKVGEQEYFESIKKLDVSWAMGKVTLIQDINLPSIVIEEKNELDDTLKVHSCINNGTLYVKFAESGAQGYVLGTDKHVTIKYPSAIDLIDIVVTSGTLEADYLSSEKIDIVRTSGTTNIKKIETPKFLYTQTNGSTNINELECEDIKINSTSGGVLIDSIKCESFSLIYTSGGINVKFIEVREASIDGTSGSPIVTIPEAGATVHYHITSGSFKCSRAGIEEDHSIVIGDGIAEIHVSVTSGNINIK